MERPNPHGFSVTVLAHVADTGGAGGNVVADRARLPCRGAQDHRGLAGFGHPQPHPDGEQLPDGQDVFGRILHRGDHGDTDRAALGQQQSQELFYFGADLAVPDVGGQRRDFIDDQHDQRFGGGGGVQAGLTAQPLRALLHHRRDGPQ